MKKIILFVSGLALFISCSSNNDGVDDVPVNKDGYDRTALLVNWADNIIIPSFQNYEAKVQELITANNTFTASPSQVNLDVVRTKWLEAYKLYQRAYIFEIGKAEQIKFNDFTNTYPTNTTDIQTNISTGTYNLAALSQNDNQGFPAIDYMINGLAGTDAEILDFYTTNADATKYKNYLTAIVNRLKINVDLILTDWNTTFRNSFVTNNGSSATSSTNKMVNIFVKNYEYYLRALKVGVPSGALTDHITNPTKTEGYYKNDVSRELLLEAVQANQDFFNGKKANQTGNGESLKAYLDYLLTVKGGADISTVINNQFTAIYTSINTVSPSFSDQITNDNTKMLALYDELQKNVRNFKIDLMQKMDIVVDYIDNDGD